MLTMTIFLNVKENIYFLIYNNISDPLHEIMRDPGPLTPPPPRAIGPPQVPESRPRGWCATGQPQALECRHDAPLQAAQSGHRDPRAPAGLQEPQWKPRGPAAGPATAVRADIL